MKNSREHHGWISGVRTRSRTVALAVALVLTAAVIGSPSAQAQTFTLLYSFQGPPLDGMNPEGELAFDQSGNLYGATVGGGSSLVHAGTVFELDVFNKETVLYNFIGTSVDGSLPRGGIVRYAGNLYGVTFEGGGADCNSTGCGVIFELSQGKEKIVHTFDGLDGSFPSAGLARDASGNLYGVTGFGDNTACTFGCGTVFEVSNGQTTVLYAFGGAPDGADPSGRLIFDRLGNLYGVTAFGGEFGEGTVFELMPDSDGTWTEHLLYTSAETATEECQSGLWQWMRTEAFTAPPGKAAASLARQPRARNAQSVVV